jgi:hypothetical protein
LLVSLVELLIAAYAVRRAGMVAAAAVLLVFTGVVALIHPAESNPDLRPVTPLFREQVLLRCDLLFEGDRIEANQLLTWPDSTLVAYTNVAFSPACMSDQMSLSPAAISFVQQNVTPEAAGKLSAPLVPSGPNVAKTGISAN